MLSVKSSCVMRIISFSIMWELKYQKYRSAVSYRNSDFSINDSIEVSPNTSLNYLWWSSFIEPLSYSWRLTTWYIQGSCKISQVKFRARQANLRPTIKLIIRTKKLPKQLNGKITTPWTPNRHTESDLNVTVGLLIIAICWRHYMY